MGLLILIGLIVTVFVWSQFGWVWGLIAGFLLLGGAGWKFLFGLVGSLLGRAPLAEGHTEERSLAHEYFSAPRAPGAKALIENPPQSPLPIGWFVPTVEGLRLHTTQERFVIPWSEIESAVWASDRVTFHVRPRFHFAHPFTGEVIPIRALRLEFSGANAQQVRSEWHAFIETPQSRILSP
jgi:hypothetical protein